MTNQEELGDRERIYACVIRELASTQIMQRAGHRQEDFADTCGGYYVHFAYYREPVPCDLVLCKTSGLHGPHPWLIAWYVEHEPKGYGTALLREVGTSRLCNMGNESFVPIVGMRPLDLLEGWQHLFHLKVRQAFARGNEYAYRFGGLEFPEQWIGRVWIREVFGGLLKPGDSLPFSIDIPFSKRTGIKAILSALQLGGYGTRPFERRQEAVA